MKLEGDYRFDAAVQDVWDALFDTAVLAAALPGCEKLDLVDGVLVGEMTIKIGPISGKFTGKVELKDKLPPERYTMIVDGRGPQGFVKATAAIELVADGDRTQIRYTADAQIGGKLASVGQRLIDASARAITKQSLDNLHENIKIRAAARAEPEPPTSMDNPSPPAPERTPVEPPQPSPSGSSQPEHAASPPAQATRLPIPEPSSANHAPVYKRAEASDMAKAVAKEVGKTMLPAIVIGAVLIAIVLWLVLR